MGRLTLTHNVTKESFDRWVLANHVGRATRKEPKEWNREDEFYYRIGELYYRIRYADVLERMV